MVTLSDGVLVTDVDADVDVLSLLEVLPEADSDEVHVAVVETVVLSDCVHVAVVDGDTVSVALVVVDPLTEPLMVDDCEVVPVTDWVPDGDVDLLLDTVMDEVDEVEGDFEVDFDCV